MSSLDLESLGFTQDELQQRVVDQICRQVLTSKGYDPETGDEWDEDSALNRDLRKVVVKRIDEQIARMAEQHILPNVSKYIEELTLQKTNQWGEKTGKEVTFIEYLVQRAEAYMLEKVNYKGMTPDHYSKGTQTRLTHLVNEHLHYSIQRAMKDALQIATSSISKGIQETVKLKLQELSESLQVAVKMKS